MPEWTSIQHWLNHNPGVSQVIGALILGIFGLLTTMLVIFREEIRAMAKHIWKNKYKLSPRHIKWTTKKLFNAAKEKRVKAEYIDLTTQTRNAIGELLILVRRLAETVQTVIKQQPEITELTEQITRLVEETQETGKDRRFTRMYQKIADIDNIIRDILDKNKKWEGMKNYSKGSTKL